MLGNGPFVAACAVFAVGAVALSGIDRGLMTSPVAPGPLPVTLEAQLAAIIPAEGPVEEEAAGAAVSSTAPAPEAISGTGAGVSGTADKGEKSAEKGGEEHEPKKSFTGKVLSAEPGTPSITLGRLKVESRKDLKSDAEAAFTPPSLRSPELSELLKRRFRFTPYAHDAVRGPAEAAITVIEFSDLSCLACMDDLKKADELYAASKTPIRYVQVYLPVEADHQTNTAAFYGKVAQRGGKFWEYRKALFDLKDPNPTAYFDALVAVGVPAMDARRWLTTEARRFYRELDADAQLSRALGLDKPPHFFVNGIHLGDGGIPRSELEGVLSYETNYTHYELDNLGHD